MVAVAERFWSKVDKSGDCWLWTGCRNQDGYGKIKVNGKTVRAHRLVIELDGSDIPGGMCVLHTCDNPSCVKPDHLWLGTQQENIDDMASKGRHGHAKLSPEDVVEIRRRRPTMTLQALADEYGVSIEAIRKRCLNVC